MKFFTITLRRMILEAFIYQFYSLRKHLFTAITKDFHPILIRCWRRTVEFYSNKVKSIQTRI